MIHKKVILIDDDFDDQLLFEDAVNEVTTQVECLTARNGMEAIELLNNTTPTPSLIFLDLNMPLMDGFEFLEYIKSVDQFKEIPVIIISTSNSPYDQKRSEALGAKIFFTKTSDFHDLKERLSQFLNTDFSNVGG